MKVRFDVNDAAAREAFLLSGIGDALRSLNETTTPQWGGMKAQQMVEHLLWTFEISTGRVKVASGMPEEWQARARSFLSDHRHTPRGFENPLLRNGLPSLRFPSLNEAGEALQVEARRFIERSRADPPHAAHPAFGLIGAEDWARAHFKHCVHHFLQFGLIEVEEVELSRTP